VPLNDTSTETREGTEIDLDPSNLIRDEFSAARNTPPVDLNLLYVSLLLLDEKTTWCNNPEDHYLN
jgi:hypothetical protein